jgi:hypothetical protein
MSTVRHLVQSPARKLYLIRIDRRGGLAYRRGNSNQPNWIARGKIGAQVDFTRADDSRNAQPSERGRQSVQAPSTENPKGLFPVASREMTISVPASFANSKSPH